MKMSHIEDELRAIGITPRYRGYAQAALAIELVLEDNTRLCGIMKEVYWEVADLCGCSRYAVERNLRTISHRAWRTAPERLREIAGYPLSASPTASELIAILALYIQRQDAVLSPAAPAAPG